MDPRQQRLKELLKKLAGSQVEPTDQELEQLVQTRFDSDDVHITDEFEANTLDRLHKELQDLKALTPAAHPNGRVSDAIRSKLQSIIRPRHARGRKIAWAVLAVAVAVVCALWYTLTPAKLVAMGVVSKVTGEPDVTLIKGGRPLASRLNSVVYEGSRFVTGESESIEVRFDDGTTMALESGTTYEILKGVPTSSGSSSSRPQLVYLRRGRIRVNARHNESSPIFVETPVATAEVLGTELELQVQDSRTSKSSTVVLDLEAILNVTTGRVAFFNRHGRVEVGAMAQSIATRDSGPTEPAPRRNAAFASSDGLLYAIGGNSQATTSSVTWVEAYDPTTDTWTARARLPVACAQSAAVTIAGKIYVVGGCTAQDPLDELQVYDPATNTWTRKAPMPTPRTGVAGAVIDGIFYVLSGAHGFGPLVYHELVEAYEPATDTWTTRAHMPTPRGGFGIGVIDGVLYTVGGSSASGEFLPTVEAYDPKTDTWAARAPLPTPRNGLKVGVIDGILYAIGGGVLGSNVPSRVVEAYDPATDAWTAMPRLALPLTLGGGADGGIEVIDGVMYVIGWPPPYVPGTPMTIAAFTPFHWVYTDGDGLTDSEEAHFGTETQNPDSDGDCLTDGMEVRIGTDPNLNDSDGDGVLDGEDLAPLARSVSGSRILIALRGGATAVMRLRLSVFNDKDSRAATTLRGAIRDELLKAADQVEAGHRKGAVETLRNLHERINGEKPPPIWMLNGTEKAALSTDIHQLIALLNAR